MTNKHSTTSDRQLERPTSPRGGLVRAVCRWSFAIVLLSACTASGAPSESPITASGFIEGKEVAVAAEMQGLIAEILVSRGDDVEVGEVVVRLDDSALKSQLSEAQAGLATARANLDRVEAGVRAEEIAAASASLAEAQARLSGAERAVLNSRDAISRPLALEAQIDEARAQAQLAEQNVEFQEAELEETQVKRGVYIERGGDIASTWELQLRAAEARLVKAKAQLDGARAYLGAVLAIRDNPLSLQAELHRAEMEAQLAKAESAHAQAILDELEAGATQEELALAEAHVRQAEAGVALIDVRVDQLTLTAPMDGIVSTRSSEVGEIATAGKPLLTIANLDTVTLVLYIAENRIGQVRIGQEVDVTVDSFPERTFVGRVESIAGEAEFTPRHVQTKEERVNLVFAVDVTVPNPDHALKPGMPADATIRP